MYIDYWELNKHTIKNSYPLPYVDDYSDQPTDETLILHIDSATFQATVMTAVAVVMAQSNPNNTKENENGVDTLNPNDNQGNQQKPPMK